MLGCYLSAVVFSPESSVCRECPQFEGCDQAALAKTLLKRPTASAAFLSVKFANVDADQDDLLDIRLSSVSERVKGQAFLLASKGFRFAAARQQIADGQNPFSALRTQRAYVIVYDTLLETGHARKRDLINAVVSYMQCSLNTASSLVSDALGLGELMRIVTTTRFTATLCTGKTQ